MNPKITNKKITVYTSVVNTTTRKTEYTKQIIGGVAFYEKNIASNDTTGIKNHREAIAIIPYKNIVYSAKLGDYFIEGEGENFTTLDALKKNHRVYEIMQSDLKLDGNAPHLYIRGV